MFDLFFFYEFVINVVDIVFDIMVLIYGLVGFGYGELSVLVFCFVGGFYVLGVKWGEWVVVYLEKCFEMVIVSFGSLVVGVVFVLINLLFKVE